MPLREELVQQGQWLFRWRSYLPLAALPLVVVELARSAGEPVEVWWWPLCVAVSLAGLGIRIHIAGHVPKQTSGRNTVRQMAAALNTTGFYSVARHPLYLGNLLMWLGLSLTAHSAWVTLLILLVFWIYYERIMLAEEEYLRGRFDEEFERWAAATPAILPRWAAWRSPTLPFSVRAAVRREYSSFFAVAGLFVFLDFVRAATAHGGLYVAPAQAVVVAAGLVFYAALILIKKKTALLQVEGR
jgi:protein-S-isoprenylcysteine O-methyltransferase Ste14